MPEQDWVKEIGVTRGGGGSSLRGMLDTYCGWRKRLEYDIRGIFPREYSLGNIPEEYSPGNIPRGTFPGEYSPGGIFPGEYSPDVI